MYFKIESQVGKNRTDVFKDLVSFRMYNTRTVRYIPIGRLFPKLVCQIFLPFVDYCREEIKPRGSDTVERHQSCFGCGNMDGDLVNVIHKDMIPQYHAEYLRRVFVCLTCVDLMVTYTQFERIPQCKSFWEFVQHLSFQPLVQTVEVEQYGWKYDNVPDEDDIYTEYVMYIPWDNRSQVKYVDRAGLSCRRYECIFSHMLIFVSMIDVIEHLTFTYPANCGNYLDWIECLGSREISAKDLEWMLVDINDILMKERKNRSNRLSWLPSEIVQQISRFVYHLYLGDYTQTGIKYDKYRSHVEDDEVE